MLDYRAKHLNNLYIIIIFSGKKILAICTMINKFNQKYIENVYFLLQKETVTPSTWGYNNDILMPFATGEYCVYHNNIDKQYKIILPRRFKIFLFYQEKIIQFLKYCPYATNWADRKIFSDYEEYYTVQMLVDLTDYFECIEYKNTIIPLALNKKGIEGKVKQAIKLAAFV